MHRLTAIRPCPNRCRCIAARASTTSRSARAISSARSRRSAPTVCRCSAFPAIITTTLAAQYALPDDLLDTLRTHNILYDRDERGGEFFHAYTEQLDQRFCLEIVE